MSIYWCIHPTFSILSLIGKNDDPLQAICKTWAGSAAIPNTRYDQPLAGFLSPGRLGEYAVPGVCVTGNELGGVAGRKT